MTLVFYQIIQRRQHIHQDSSPTRAVLKYYQIWPDLSYSDAPTGTEVYRKRLSWLVWQGTYASTFI